MHEDLRERVDRLVDVFEHPLLACGNGRAHGVVDVLVQLLGARPQ
jgi:hypothetical protein